MIHMITEFHSMLEKGQCVRVITDTDYKTHIHKTDLLTPMGNSVLRVAGNKGQVMALNCEHVVMACIVEEW